MDSKPLVISQGKLPIWRALLATLCFMGALYILALDVWSIYRIGCNEKLLMTCARSLEGVVYFFLGGVFFGLRRTVRIVPSENVLYTDLHVGPFSKTYKQQAPKLNYMSVFKNSRDMFEANLWYKGNKHYKMSAFYTQEEAFTFAKKIATKLNIDLLDATGKGDFTWIELTNTNA